MVKNNQMKILTIHFKITKEEATLLSLANIAEIKFNKLLVRHKLDRSVMKFSAMKFNEDGSVDYLYKSKGVSQKLKDFYIEKGWNIVANHL